MRSLWTGALSFGLVNIPVSVHHAVRRGGRFRFRLLHKIDHSPIRYERVCEKEGAAVDWDDVVKGFEYAKERFVVLTDDDFKSAAIESSKTLDILDFVRADEIDPRYFETPYYLTPRRGGEKAYALLREAIRKTGTVGIGRITLRTGVIHLAGVKTVGPALVLEIMRFAADLTDVAALSLPPRADLGAQELELAEQLVQNLTTSFEPSKYRDDYRENLLAIIRAKTKGKHVAVAEPADRETTPVVDLMARLKASLEAGKRRQAGAHRPAPPSGMRRTRRIARKGRTA